MSMSVIAVSVVCTATISKGCLQAQSLPSVLFCILCTLSIVTQDKRVFRSACDYSLTTRIAYLDFINSSYSCSLACFTVDSCYDTPLLCQISSSGQLRDLLGQVAFILSQKCQCLLQGGEIFPGLIPFFSAGSGGTFQLSHCLLESS